MSEKPSLKQLGPYSIQRVVGRGGMGSVFAARHDISGEEAAIKVLAPALASDEAFRERFIAEIESLKKLNHPHIVKLHGYGEHDGHLYYAMELIHGTTLAHEIQAGRRFSWREVTQLGIDISRALKHAHDHGVIHRDLKPANLLVDKMDVVRLSDFGIAKLFGGNNITSNGSVLGTADYMAPEQTSGDATSPRCDLYSLGSVMYALLAGRPPFSGKSIAEVVHCVRYDEPDPVSKYVHDVPQELQQIISELLEKDPDDRVRTALSLTHRLSAMQQALSIQTTDQDDFSGDLESGFERHAVTNPPPDIAERPTVCLPNEATAQSDKLAAGLPTQKSKSTSKSKSKAKRDHFTRVERDVSRSHEGRSEFTSALPLMLLLLTVLGGLLTAIWYSSLPLSADALHVRIANARAGDATKMLAASGDVKAFMRKFKDDSRYASVAEFKGEIEILELQKSLERRALRRKETGSLSPVEWHCHEAFILYRKGELDLAVERLESIREFYGSPESQSDFKIQNALEMVEQLIPEWNAKVQADVEGLEVELTEKLRRAREDVANDRHRACNIWQSTLKLYGDRPWAREHVEEARRMLVKYPPSPTPDSPSIASPDLHAPAASQEATGT